MLVHLAKITNQEMLIFLIKLINIGIYLNYDFLVFCYCNSCYEYASNYWMADYHPCHIGNNTKLI